ncbi:hypothetical protein [Amycolatopsis echigonensis]|uniref:hypothetical protein n=1 Tax=Amycolatopsis echigonensis TaxID=2576905 RepID=UPI001177C67F|nr:hypothetical protein [Amycolatopsis niigatensis]
MFCIGSNGKLLGQSWHAPCAGRESARLNLFGREYVAGSLIAAVATPTYSSNMPLGMTRPLRAALDGVSTPAELLGRLAYPSLASQYPQTATLEQLLAAAAHEAALRRHPYVSPEHVMMAAARQVGDAQLASSLAARLEARSVRTRRWWRPLGRKSALRPRNQRLLDDQQRAAQEREQRRSGDGDFPEPPGG